MQQRKLWSTWVNTFSSSNLLSSFPILIFISLSLSLSFCNFFFCYNENSCIFCIRSIAHPGREIGYLNDIFSQSNLMINFHFFSKNHDRNASILTRATCNSILSPRKICFSYPNQRSSHFLTDARR